MRFTVIFTFVSLLLALGCNKKINSAAAAAPGDEMTKVVETNEIVSLARGESARTAKMTGGVRFDSVASDNRCPREVNCITAGEALVMVSLAGGAAQKVKVEDDPKRTNRLSLEGATVELLALDPYPQARVKIDPAEIRLRVRIIDAAQQ